MKPRKISGIIPAWLRVPRKKNSNKSSYGRVLVVAGSDGMAGAAILCSRAALRAGAGLVTVAVPRCIQPVVSVCLPEAMTLGLPHSAGKIDGKKSSRILTKWLASKGCDLIVAGPGLGQGAGVPALLRQLAGSGKPLLLDADALNALAKNKKWVNLCRRSLMIITPHPGEAARLLQSSVCKVQQSRRQSVIKLAEICGGIALLKGRQTLV
ncbi:MAG TPA: NAD(P)H-hydrate dehydratase, partial [Elusimicrobiales bacterium]|nr:NAD(P)H-hydrate dehydratase [Elusimicrobiales bacterium]